MIQLKQSEESNKTTILPRIQQSKNDSEDRYLFYISTSAFLASFLLYILYSFLNRYKEANTRLRKLLADERRSLQQVRQNYSQELKTRTEMEMLLRSCVEDVRKEIARRYKH